MPLNTPARWSSAHVTLREPYLKRLELLAEKGRVLVLEGREVRGHRCAVVLCLGARLLLGEEGGQLREALIDGEVPAVPQWVIVRRRQAWMADGRAVVETHDALCEQVVSQQGSDHEIVAEESAEEGPRQDGPCDRVGDRGQGPVEFAQRRASVLQLTWDIHDNVDIEGAGQWVLQDEPSQRNLDGRGQAARKQIRRQVGVHWEHFVGATGCQVNRVAQWELRLASCIGEDAVRAGYRRRLASLCRRQLDFVLGTQLGEAPEVGDNMAGGARVPHIDARVAQPCLQVVQGQGNVLRVRLVEDPNFATGCGFRHAVAIVVEEHALVFGRAAQIRTEALGLLDDRIEVLLVARLHTQRLELHLQVAPDRRQCLRRVQRLGIHPADQLRAWVRLAHIRRIHADVEAHHEGGCDRAQPLPHAPIGQILRASWARNAVRRMPLVAPVRHVRQLQDDPVLGLGLQQRTMPWARGLVGLLLVAVPGRAAHAHRHRRSLELLDIGLCQRIVRRCLNHGAAHALTCSAGPTRHLMDVHTLPRWACHAPRTRPTETPPRRTGRSGAPGACIDTPDALTGGWLWSTTCLDAGSSL